MSEQYPKFYTFQRGNDRTFYFFVYVHQKELSKIGLKTRSNISLWDTELIVPLNVQTVHSNEQIGSQCLLGSQSEAAEVSKNLRKSIFYEHC